MPSLFGVAHDILGFWLLGALGLSIALGLFLFDLFCDTELQPFFLVYPVQRAIAKMPRSGCIITVTAHSEQGK